ncbi:hypothetical protein PT015_03955 [Candidatus Mycobacterium wuenschmannii]|uniref:Sulfotransferase family protein n=1 Tax=Candidatus Mycobacterium wuenschmannii TaxID=3027808 RepID=A0ABY8W4G4_9MYCO|nr:hypothetical protein [Candidatus Mycobacterium wuenschmannii]WIM88659.1 hypothetical protein PT015_03955 [Candidatus Mycobacterium wuenschmannii]
MEIADLARWTPVRVDLTGPAPAIDWADMTAERFVEPFFDQTVGRWSAGPRATPLVRTGLEALLALDGQPSLDPAGMIFHFSRCGSTLVSRLLSTIPGVVVIAEPSPLNALLGLDPRQVDGATLVQVVRLLVRALGRRRHGDERHLVLKCSSWNVRRQEILTAAFPAAPWAWVQRDPVQVLSSLLAEPPGWLGEQVPPPQTAAIFGIDPTSVAGMTRAEFAARALGAMLFSAAIGPGRRVCVDHSALPDAVWERVAPHFGIAVEAADIERMTEQAAYYSKSVVIQPYSGEDLRIRPMTDEMRDAALRYAEPGYRQLASLR